jgi:hypothetical protein
MQNGSQRVIIELKGVEKTYFLEGDNQVHALARGRSQYQAGIVRWR